VSDTGDTKSVPATLRSFTTLALRGRHAMQHLSPANARWSAPCTLARGSRALAPAQRNPRSCVRAICSRALRLGTDGPLRSITFCRDCRVQRRCRSPGHCRDLRFPSLSDAVKSTYCNCPADPASSFDRHCRRTRMRGAFSCAIFLTRHAIIGS
jgi:hypothetical protein